MELGENLRVIAKGAPLAGSATLIIEDIDSGKRYMFLEFGFEADIKKRILLSVIRELEARIEEIEPVNHPALIKPVGIKRYNGRYHLVSEPCKSGTLLSEYPIEGNLDIAQSLSWMERVAEVMGQYHDQDRVMYGPRADNILVSNDGNIALLDPKICDILQQFRSGATRAANYLPPEVAQGGIWDRSSDLFAFGVLSYYLLSGRLPFDDEDPSQITRKVLEWEPWDVRTVNPGVSAPLATFTMALISKDPAGRPTDIHDISSKLQAVRTSGTLTASPTERRMFEAKRRSIAQKRRFEGAGRFLRRRWAFIAACIVGIAVLILLFTPTYVTPAITSETPPEEVIKIYYKAIDELDIKALEEAIDRRAGRHILDLLTNVYILEQANKSLEFREAMFKAMKPGDASERMARVDLVKVEDLKIAPFGSEGNTLQFKATYRFTLPSPQGPQITEHEDTLTLSRVRGRWKIVKLDEKASAVRAAGNSQQ